MVWDVKSLRHAESGGCRHLRESPGPGWPQRTGQSHWQSTASAGLHHPKPRVQRQPPDCSRSSQGFPSVSFCSPAFSPWLCLPGNGGQSQKSQPLPFGPTFKNFVSGKSLEDYFVQPSIPRRSPSGDSTRGFPLLSSSSRVEPGSLQPGLLPSKPRPSAQVLPLEPLE